MYLCIHGFEFKKSKPTDISLFLQMDTLGDAFDNVATGMQKAQFLAEKMTRDYFENSCDATALQWLCWYEATHSVRDTDLFMAFFQRHAKVFGVPGPNMQWDCRNPSACLINLIKELTDDNFN